MNVNTGLAQGQDFFDRPVIDRDCMAGGFQPLGHRPSHQPCSQDRDVHRGTSLRLVSTRRSRLLTGGKGNEPLSFQREQPIL